MRGLACVLMFQDHCYTSWLSPELQQGEFTRWSQIIGSMPAPLFLFLAGVSVALTTEKLREKGVTRNLIAKQTILRGGEIFGLGLVFRVQEYALGHRWVPWTDLLRVDILNILGLSMAFLGILCWFATGPTVEIARRRSLYAGLATAAAIALLTPPLWTTWRPRFLPWPVESYVNGVHNLNEPQNWLFPIFPWCAFAFVGLAAGFSLFSGTAEKSAIAIFLVDSRNRRWRLRALAGIRIRAAEDLRGARLLALTSGFFSVAVRSAADPDVVSLLMVRPGMGTRRLQPLHTVWEDFAAGLLGTH